jgi:hypothetical protein
MFFFVFDGTGLWEVDGDVPVLLLALVLFYFCRIDCGF